MKILIKFLIFFLVGLLVFVGVMKAIGWGTVEESFSVLLSLKGLVVVGISFLLALLNTAKWQFVLKKIGIKRRLRRLFKIWLPTYAVTFIFSPFGGLAGETLRSYFAKEELNLSWEESITSIAIERVIDITVFVIFIIGGMVTFIFSANIVPPVWSWVAVLFLVSLISFLVFFYFKTHRRQTIIRNALKKIGIKKILKQDNLVFKVEKRVINFMHFKNKDFWKGIGWATSKHFVNFVKVAVLAFFLIKEIDFALAGSMYGLACLAFLVPIPMVLGSLEIAGILGFSALGFSASLGTVFSMVIRNADILVSILGIVFLVRITSKITEGKALELINKISNNKRK